MSFQSAKCHRHPLHALRAICLVAAVGPVALLTPSPGQVGGLEGLLGPPGGGVAAGGAAHVTWEARVEPAAAPPSGEVEVVLSYKLAKGWHLYSPEHKATGKPTKVTVSGEGLEAQGPPTYPKPIVKVDPLLGETQSLLEGEGALRQRVTIAAGAAGMRKVTAQVAYMTCSEKTCDPPAQKSFDLEVEVLAAPSAGAASTPASTTPAATESRPALPATSPPAGTLATPIVRTHSTWRLSLEPASVPAGGTLEVLAAYELAPGWHIYSPDHDSPLGLGVPTAVSVAASALERSGAAKHPAPTVHQDEMTLQEEHRYLDGKGAVRQAFKIAANTPPGKLSLPVKVAFMTCDKETCDPPDALETTLEVIVLPAGASGAPDEAAAGAQGGAPSGMAAPGGDEASAPPAGGALAGSGGIGAMDLWALVLAMVGGAIFTLLMPCTYPMIPITIAYFTKQADARQGKVLGLALAYGAGIILVFNVIGWLFAGSIGPFAANGWVNLFFGLAFVALGLSFLGLYELRLPGFLNQLASKASGRGGYLGVFLIGATLVITSFTCTAPILGPLLTYASQGGGLGRVTLSMSVFGAVMALPFVILSLFPSKARSLPRAGAWMQKLKVSLGIVELAAALKFFSNTDLSWGTRWLPREPFLAVWVGALVFMSLYVIGVFDRRSDRRTPRSRARWVPAALFLALAAYWSQGLTGRRLDFVTEALAPPFHASFSWIEQDAAGWTLVEDDLEGGLRQAQRQGKRALINFTGVT